MPGMCRLFLLSLLKERRAWQREVSETGTDPTNVRGMLLDSRMKDGENVDRDDDEEQEKRRREN